jgi:hypothetical protein
MVNRLNNSAFNSSNFWGFWFLKCKFIKYIRLHKEFNLLFFNKVDLIKSRFTDGSY